MSRDEVVSIEVVRGVVAQRAKAFEAAMTSDPAQGRIRPVGYSAWMAAVMADFAREPKLRECAAQAPETVLECLSAAANCGLVPGASAGKFYLIPRWNSKRSRMECTFIVGYKGLAELAYRHPRVHRAEAFVVYEGEEFSFSPGSGVLVHNQRWDVDRSDKSIVGAYSRVELTIGSGTMLDQRPLVCPMSIAEILKVKERSQAAKSGFSPWATDFAAMVRKTPMRRHYNGGSVPQSGDMIVAVSAEIEQESRLDAEAAMLPTEKAAGGLRAALGITASDAVVVDKVAADPYGDGGADGRLTVDPIDNEFDEAARRARGS